MQKNWKLESKKKYLDPKTIEESIQTFRQQGKTLVTLNGSFDLFHAGHLHILYEASLQADLLIVALNSDASIRAYKNPKRPIIPLPYRLQLLSAIEFVDYVTYFDETDPRDLLSKIKPDVHVNGAEYGKNCIEAETVKAFGGTLHLVEKIDQLSTSALIEKIIQCVS